jgi:hypothetical protein
MMLVYLAPNQAGQRNSIIEEAAANWHKPDVACFLQSKRSAIGRFRGGPQRRRS